MERDPPDRLRAEVAFDGRLDVGLELPPLRGDRAGFERLFADGTQTAARPIRNPHREPRVSSAERRRAVPAAVLIPLAQRPSGPALLLTRRHEQISFGGHVCLPGGRADPGDASPVSTALREAHEEIGLHPRHVEVLGRLGDYVTHSGFRIAPVVGWIAEPPALVAHPHEVDEILEVPLERVLHPEAYALRTSTFAEGRAYYVLEHDGAVVTGPTVSILIGLYEALADVG